jgi:tetratricopeptide (TPR) repeat protein
LGRRRTVRKKKLDQDRFVETTFTAVEYVRDNPQKVALGVVGLAIVVVVAVLFLRGAGSAISPDAQVELAIANELYFSGRTDEAISAYRDMISRYPGTESALAARCFLGSAYYHLYEYSSAEDELQKVLEGTSTEQTALTLAAVRGLGAVYEATARFGQAASLYERYAYHPGFDTAEMLIAAIRAYRQDADWPSVQRLAGTVAEEYPARAPEALEYAQEATEKLRAAVG